MDLKLSAADGEFIAAAALFLERHWRLADALLVGQRGQLVQTRYLAALADSGRMVGHWPARHGGLGWTPRQRWLWEREAARVQAPQPCVHGPDLLATALFQHGTRAQQSAYLPAIAQGHVTWCQAFGEDSGGLDVLQVTTQARQTEQGWTLDGHKPWVLDVPAQDVLPLGRHWVYLLARVQNASTEGFGVFLLDLASSGVVVTPIRMLGENAADATGTPVSGRHSVGSIEFSGVALPLNALLGPVDTSATLALAIEQAEFAQPAVVARNDILLVQLRDFVESGELDGGSLWRDDDYRTKLHELEVAMASLYALQARALHEEIRREGASGSGDERQGAVEDGDLGAGSEFAQTANLLVASRSRQLSQQLADLQVEALGYFALPYANLTALDNEGPIGSEFSQPVLFGMLSNRAREAILAPRDHLKNIIAKSVLGLSSATLLSLSRNSELT